MKECPGCHRQFADADQFCPFDGGRLVSTKVPLSVAPPDAKTSLIPVARLPDAAAERIPLAPVAEPEAAEPASGRAPARALVRPPVKPPVQQLREDYHDLIGKVLDGRYQIEERIGEGGMGVVFRAKHVVIEKPVAIKVLKRAVAGDQNVVRRFVQEAKAASRIGHVNIVDVTDFGATPNGTTYSVMEYVRGRTLATELKKLNRMPLARAVGIALQITRALGAAHAKGIVHRDLKPENIFLTRSRGEDEGEDDFVKIVDFGIAKVTQIERDPTVSPRLTKQGTVFGTAEYMPPEQAAGKPTDHRVDIYALGIILYEMLVGRVPHKGETVMRTLAMQIVDPITPPSDAAPEAGLSRNVDAVIMRALAKRRSHRYQTMAELRTGLESLVEARLSMARSRALPAQSPPMAKPAEPTLNPQRELALEAGARAAAMESDTFTESNPSTLVGDPLFTGTAPRILRRFDDLLPEPADAPSGPSRWPQVLAVVMLVGAAVTGAIAYLQSTQTRAVVVGPPPTPALPDAGLLAVVPVPPDAAVEIELADPDAGVDHQVVPIRRPRRRVRQTISTEPVRSFPRGNVDIVVETRPRGGRLYLGDGAYGGPDGTVVRRAGGKRLSVTCKLPGYQSGTADLLFDGIVDVAICRMTRIKKCLPGVRNPFDDCTDRED